jgi:drug/metabolite transporter (DMT)-like permease
MFALNGLQAMLLSTLFFSGMNVCVKILPRVPAHEIVFFRSLGMALICVVLLKRQHIPMVRISHRRDLFLRGVFGTCGLLAYFYTLKHMGFAAAVTLQYLNPIFATVLAVFILKESVRWFQWIFFGLSCVGVWWVKGFSGNIAPVYLLTGILAAFFSGLAYNYVRKLGGKAHPVVIIFYSAAVTLLFVGPYTLSHWIWPVGVEWLSLVLVAGFTYLAQFFMTLAYQSERMAIVSNLNYLGLVYALVLGYVLFDEAVSWQALMGMVLIVLGVVLGSNRKIHSWLTRGFSENAVASTAEGKRCSRPKWH